MPVKNAEKISAEDQKIANQILTILQNVQRGSFKSVLKTNSKKI
jgi:Txe/YoeB family toxin of Txe-Axe toxin-antitoxin module